MNLLTPAPPTSLRELRFAVLDLETNGGHPRSGWTADATFRPGAEITEIGIVQLCGLVKEQTFQSLCAIEGPLPPAIQRLTGITPSLLQGAPDWEAVALRAMPCLEGRIWVAHHAPFDGSFLKHQLPEGVWRRHLLICTRLLAKALIPEATQRSLGALIQLLNLHNRRPHRALEDAEATAELLQIILSRAEARGLDAEAFLALGRVGWEKL